MTLAAVPVESRAADQVAPAQSGANGLGVSEKLRSSQEVIGENFLSLLCVCRVHTICRVIEKYRRCGTLETSLWEIKNCDRLLKMIKT